MENDYNVNKSYNWRPNFEGYRSSEVVWRSSCAGSIPYTPRSLEGFDGEEGRRIFVGYSGEGV
jgi:hypothetical protein